MRARSALSGVLVALGLSVFPTAIRAQSCDGVHYRWSAKTSTSSAGEAPHTTTITSILTQWKVPPLGPGPTYWCASRVGRERETYLVDGWLSFADTTKDDGDWHIELIERPDDPREQCIVAEIPAPRWDSVFAAPRATLQAALRSGRSMWHHDGRLVPPIHVRVIGAAFFDAEHIHGHKRPRAQRHGHCNSSLLALWELHPIYRLEALQTIAPTQKAKPERR